MVSLVLSLAFPFLSMEWLFYILLCSPCYLCHMAITFSPGLFIMYYKDLWKIFLLNLPCISLILRTSLTLKTLISKFYMYNNSFNFCWISLYFLPHLSVRRPVTILQHLRRMAVLGTDAPEGIYNLYIELIANVSRACYPCLLLCANWGGVPRTPIKLGTLSPA